jgi:demethylmenaquinone methyltransferase/2-methoxy-6-polyprenyl-1,4-benzoquinol methylase
MRVRLSDDTARMTNPFYSPGAQRAAKVNDLFAAIASRYDLINDVQSLGLHRRWKRRVVQLAAVSPGDRALDLCCGTGDIALALAARGAAVVGLDFSEPMLAVAEQRRSKIQGPKSRAGASLQVDFLRGDAMRIPFPDEAFEIVTVGYGLRNLASWETGLREMARVARKGARLIVLDFGKPDNRLWQAVYFGYLKLFVPMFGLIFCRNASAYAYILESLKHYPAQSGVAGKMHELGLVNVRIVNLLGGAMSINYGEKAREQQAGIRSPVLKPPATQPGGNPTSNPGFI